MGAFCSGRARLALDVARSALAEQGLGVGGRGAAFGGVGQLWDAVALFLCLRPLRHGFFADDDVGCVPVGLGALGDGI